jgi:hypothetical protein
MGRDVAGREENGYVLAFHKGAGMTTPLKCIKCGWEWLKRRGRPDPETCPNPKCRTRNWRAEEPAKRTLDYTEGQ